MSGVTVGVMFFFSLLSISFYLQFDSNCFPCHHLFPTVSEPPSHLDLVWTHVSRVAERRLELRTNSFAGRRYISPQNEPWAPWLPSVPQLCGSRLVWPGSRLVEGLGHIGNLEVPGLVSTATGQRTEMLCFFLFALNHLFFFFFLTSFCPGVWSVNNLLFSLPRILYLN